VQDAATLLLIPKSATLDDLERPLAFNYCTEALKMRDWKIEHHVGPENARKTN